MPRARASPPSKLGRVLVTLALVPIALSFAVSTCSPRATRRDRLSRRGALQYAWARDHLEAPFDGYGLWDDLGVPAFDAILVSHLAMGLMNVAHLTPERRAELGPLAEEAARRVLDARVRPVDPSGPIGDHNLYASHALFVLGVEHHLAGPHPDHDRVAEHLARHLVRASSHPSAHARSYPGSPRWPADQAVTLAALTLHDREHGTTHSGRPVARWLAWLEAHQSGDLPWSAVSGTGYDAIPRGCALSFMATYMAHFAPDEGARIYDRYRDAHGLDRLGFGGFREWPEGEDRGSDVDAGPVILGWGTAATGIGLGAARLYGDARQVAGIERLADAVGGGVPLSGRYLLAPTLGQAMLFSGETATPWGEEVPLRRSEDTGWPLGALLLTLVSLTPILVAWRRYARAMRALALTLLLTSCATTAATSHPVENGSSANVRSFGTSRWVGRYACPQGVTGLTLEIVATPSGATATFRFYAVPENPGVPSGAFVMRGSVRADGVVELAPDHWIEQPEGYWMVGLVGVIDPSGTLLSGHVHETACGAFELVRA